MGYHKDLCAPAVIEIPGGLKDGHQFTIFGKVSGERFSVNFQKDQTDDSDIAFHFNPRIPEQSVVRNTYQNEWQTEELDIPDFPFCDGQQFKIHVIVTPTGYAVYVNSVFYISYDHRINHHDMCYLKLTEGADWHEVYIREKCRVPYTRPLPQLSDGMCVSVRGLIHTDANGFSVNFTGDDSCDLIALHCNPRQNENDTVLNSKIDGCWGEEIRGFSYFPFNKGEFCELTFLVHEGSFIIAANKQHLSNYVYRVPLEQIKFLNIHGDIALMDVTFYDQVLNDWVKPIHGGLEMDDMITVEGFIKPGSEKFVVSLLTGMDTCPGRALHINPLIPQNEVVINNTMDGCWQKEVKYPLQAPWHEPVPFTIDIVNKEYWFDIYIDGKKLGEFTHRECVDNIKAIYCDDSAYFHSIKVHHILANPHVKKTAVTPSVGSWGCVVGIPISRAEKFIIDIKSGSDTEDTACDDILFRYNPNFLVSSTVRNTMENGNWGCDEICEDSFPFNRQQVFEFNVLLDESAYKVVANGRHHIDYKHRIPANRISHIITKLDADFYMKESY